MEELERERAILRQLIERVEAKGAAREKGESYVTETIEDTPRPCQPVRSTLSQAEKIALFRSLFRGREDVFALRFESTRTGRSGYQPACRNEWVRGICRKPQIKCTNCDQRDLLPLTDEVVRNHLLGRDPTARRPKEFVVGIYPLLPDETCWFLAVDFDKETWTDDVRAFVDTCRDRDVSVAVERSRSGNGAHAWVFFSQPVLAAMARRMGSALITATMENRPELGLDSYDRLFPNQDTMPSGGFGNLIALPFQRTAVEQGNTLFLDEDLKPFPDQWAYLSAIERVDPAQLSALVEDAARQGKVLGVRLAVTEDNEEDPWTAPPSRRSKERPIAGDLPAKVSIVLGNEIYIEKDGLPPALINRLIRLAAFQNPEFYRNQAMRRLIWNTPRVIGCAEDFPKHLGLPIGCLDDVTRVFSDLGVTTRITDERVSGVPLNVNFLGVLRPEQRLAADRLRKQENGVLAATTAFGKTVVAIYLLAQHAVNTLILVHRKQLMDQWIERLVAFLDVDVSDIGSIGGGKRKPKGKIDVALIQSLCRKGVVHDVVADYGHLIVDECHHISAPSFEQVARRCKARYITGLSATVVRKDGHHPIIVMQCGPIRYKSDARQEASKRPFEHKVLVRETAFQFEEDERTQMHELYAALTADEQRNALIVDDVCCAVRAGRSPVVLTERRQHVDCLRDMLEGKVTNLAVLTGGMGVRQRRAAMAELAAIPAQEERVILATGRYLGEGFDDARLDTLFLALPISWRGTLAQYAGRLHRERDMKREVVIYDYADLKVPMLERMFRRRLRGYDAIGYRIDDPRQQGLDLWDQSGNDHPPASPPERL